MIWSEWDIGHERVVFASKDLAIQWCRENENLQEVFEEGMESVEDVVDAGLLGFMPVTLIDC